MKNSQNGYIISLLIAIIVLLIIGGGVYFYEIQKAEVPVVINTNVPTQSNQTTTTAASNTIKISSAQKYTDSDFGFSFWYPSALTVIATSTQTNSEFMYGKNTKIIKKIIAPGFDIDEVYSPDMSILSSAGAGPINSPYNKYYFDAQAHTWMYYTDGESGPYPSSGGTTTADVSKNTMGGLHIFPGYVRFSEKVIIPLSAHNFLAVYAKCNDATDLPCSGTNEIEKFDKSVQTIIATDPDIAILVNVVEQGKIIKEMLDVYNK